MGQLHGLAERIHNVADELPLTDSRYTRSDDLDELDERVRDIAGLVTHLTTAAAFEDRSVNSGQGPSADVTRYKVAALTHTVRALAQALAHLGEAVSQAGRLHRLDALPRSAERSKAQQSARNAVNERIDSTRRDLNEAGRQLHHAANRLTARQGTTTPPPLPRQSPRTR
ncbi:hypothetical protein ACIRQP_35050 [Streptomyces sp. NPDC102274]|uniref:hypothetical protein n=1 Tax=Streptomyces sp. NPDC102274 TaxID=3366151 RepID=UPI0038242EB5